MIFPPPDEFLYSSYVQFCTTPGGLCQDLYMSKVARQISSHFYFVRDCVVECGLELITNLGRQLPTTQLQCYTLPVLLMTAAGMLCANLGQNGVYVWF